jgi:hypothetical protein
MAARIARVSAARVAIDEHLAKRDAVEALDDADTTAGWEAGLRVAQAHTLEREAAGVAAFLLERADTSPSRRRWRRNLSLRRRAAR